MYPPYPIFEAMLLAIIIADGSIVLLKAQLGSRNSLNTVFETFDVNFKYLMVNIFDIQSCWGFSWPFIY